MSYSLVTFKPRNIKIFAILMAATLICLIVSYFVIQSDLFDSRTSSSVSANKTNGDTFSPEISNIVLHGMKKPDHMPDKDWENFQTIRNSLAVVPLDPVEMGLVTERSGRNGSEEPMVSRTKESLQN